MTFDHKKKFRTVWNQFKTDAAAGTPKGITKEWAFVLQVNYVLSRAFKASIRVTDERAIKKALVDMERKGIPLSFARLMIHKTLFE